MSTRYMVWMATLLFAQPLLAGGPIDEFRISNIEQSVRALQTQVKEQARVIDDLQRQAGGSARAASAERRSSNVPAANNAWLSADNWKRVRNGMSELEVVSVLGPPTQMRVSDDKSTRTLLYALEIGSSGFLSGNVVFSSGGVSAVNIPILK